MSSCFGSQTILKIAFPNLDAQRGKTRTRQFDGIATLEAAQIDNKFAGDALRKQHPQELLRELNQREIFHLPWLLRLRHRPLATPHVAPVEAAPLQLTR